MRIRRLHRRAHHRARDPSPPQRATPSIPHRPGPWPAAVGDARGRTVRFRLPLPARTGVRIRSTRHLVTPTVDHRSRATPAPAAPPAHPSFPLVQASQDVLRCSRRRVGALDLLSFGEPARRNTYGPHRYSSSLEAFEPTLPLCRERPARCRGAARIPRIASPSERTGNGIPRALAYPEQRPPTRAPHVLPSPLLVHLGHHAREPFRCHLQEFLVRRQYRSEQCGNPHAITVLDGDVQLAVPVGVSQMTERREHFV